MEAKFHNNDGSLTAYALACGYVQTETVNGGRFEVRLSGGGGSGCYHVQVWDEELSLGMAAWESFDTLTEARKAVRQAIAYFRRLPADAPARERDKSPNAQPVWSS